MTGRNIFSVVPPGTPDVEVDTHPLRSPLGGMERGTLGPSPRPFSIQPVPGRPQGDSLRVRLGRVWAETTGSWTPDGGAPP